MSEQAITDAKAKLEKAMEFLHNEYRKLQTGRASAGLVEGIKVESFGTFMPIKGLATITIPESNQIAIQPWNRDQISAIEKAIMAANIGLTPSSDGVVIRLIIPPLTEERRKGLVKVVHQAAEEARISIRSARHDALNLLKTMEKNKEISEDDLVHKEKELQNTVDEYNKRVEEAAKHKEQDVMKV